MQPPSDDDIFREAIAFWWASKQNKAQKSQGGTRDDNLHGKTMDGFSIAIRQFLAGLNVDPDHVYSGQALSNTSGVLPSFFRPTKNWDVAVVAGSRCARGNKKPQSNATLYAAIEFKSQDKSIGNNANNRMEESLGNALDFWTTYQHSGFLRQQPRPWLGYMFVGNYHAEKDGTPVRITQPHFEAMLPFRVAGSGNARDYLGPSYLQRYLLFLRQVVGMRLYDAGAFIVTDETIAGEARNHRIPLPEFGPVNFLRSLKGHILGHYPGAKIVPGSLAERL